MIVNVAPFKLRSKANNGVLKNSVPYKNPQRKLTLKEMQARQYSFLDSDVSGIFDDMLEANLIDLPEMKRPEEDKVMQLARQGKTSLEEDSAATNAITIKSGYFDSNKDACNTAHRDDTKDTLLEKEDSSDADDCMP
ncbi:UNVERIFIED_CONTAM: hypothetical protein Slati_0413700 [Sesamum latifolium]|uniref:Uncharacterized protein n=1 Tax=Sesamum latifolium TaxID=2727402 RepID=A0AAW2XW54_9LAMI